MTLQEAKDQAAIEMGHKSFDRFYMSTTKEDLHGLMNRVAELYARAKWDESATITNRNIIHHTNLSLKDLPAKPEFKP
jgi:hypothetical protein